MVADRSQASPLTANLYKSFWNGFAKVTHKLTYMLQYASQQEFHGMIRIPRNS